MQHIPGDKPKSALHLSNLEFRIANNTIRQKLKILNWAILVFILEEEPFRECRM